MSIKFKWIFAFLLLVALTLGVEWFVLHQRLKHDLEKELASRLSLEAGSLAGAIEQRFGRAENLKEASQEALSTQLFDAGLRVRVGGEGGEVVFDSASRGRPQGSLSEQSLEALSGIESPWETADMLYVAHPIQGLSGVVGVLEASAPRAQVEPTLALVRHALSWTMILALLVAALMAFAISSALVRPIRELEVVAQQISNGSWRKRVRFKRNDEIGQLSETVHQMAEKLETQFGEIEGEKTTLQALLSSMIDGLIVLDEERKVKYLNPQAERSLRIRSEAAAGKVFEAVWPLREAQEIVNEGLKQASVLSREISLPYNILNLYVVPMAPVTGASAMLIFRDITELRRLEDLRNEFLGQVSHELRTPLTIVKGYVITLLDDPRLENAPEDIRKILLRIEEESDRLTKLVEELLELSRLKSGKSALSFAPIRLEEIVRDVVESLGPHAERYGIRFDLTVPGNVPLVLGDARAIRRVLLNLLDNAMKYSPREGTVEVRLTAAEQGAMLKIADQGSGISKEDLPHVFERFFQGKKKSEGKGWGLGLPIVKEIVEAHGGRIRLESQEGQGTTVTVIFPAEGLQVDERKP